LLEWEGQQGHRTKFHIGPGSELCFQS